MAVGPSCRHAVTVPQLEVSEQRPRDPVIGAVPNGLPEGGARVAFAIDDPREGPFVIVTREGRFVTCLGVGMHHDHHVVPRAQTDALLARVAVCPYVLVSLFAVIVSGAGVTAKLPAT